MPITQSAKKTLRQSFKKRKRNIERKKKIKDFSKDMKKLIDDGKGEEAKKTLPGFYKAVDKAAKSGIIKKNTASRKKSWMAAAINKIS